MRRSGLVAMVLLMLAAAVGCGDDGDGDTEVRGSGASSTAGTNVPVPSTAVVATVPPTELTLRITDVRLEYSEEPDRGMRVLLPAGVTRASVALTGLPSPNRAISVCPASGLSGPVSASTCRTPTSGEAVTVTLGGDVNGVEIVQDAASGTGSGNSTVVAETAIRYSASSREVQVRLPQLPAGEGPRPTFGLTPASTDGAYRATLTWKVIAVFGGTPSRAQLELLQGGNVDNQAQGGGDVRLSGNLPTPVTDAAIRVQNIGSSAMVTPQLTVLLP